MSIKIKGIPLLYNSRAQPIYWCEICWLRGHAVLGVLGEDIASSRDHDDDALLKVKLSKCGLTAGAAALPVPIELHSHILALRC